MKGHPIQQVRSLTQAASDADGKPSLLEDKPFDEAATPNGRSDSRPEGQQLARPQDKPVQGLRREPQVHDLVVLQARIEPG
jgi:hypothetical protein